jgi:hypothetical protein
MKNTLEKIIDKLENDTGATWSVYDCGGGSFEFSTYSPAGENVIISLDGSTLAELAADVRNAAEAFDPEEHAAQILVAKRSGTKDERRFYSAAPNSLRRLLEDAEAIAGLFKALENELKAAAGV